MTMIFMLLMAMAQAIPAPPPPPVPGGVSDSAPVAPTAILGSGRPMVVVDERTVMRQEPTPHGRIGTSTAYRISDAVPARTMEFRKRILHVGAAIGPHPLAHDEVYYVLTGEGIVSSDAQTRPLTPGMAAYLYTGASVGIRQIGKTPLTLIVAYPVVKVAD